ncbi:helix-turn-helix transcriptional regulator [Streptomyces sp. NPDC046821]|uniref:helix-turn-helix transcriptional regulator n=1 Tax=Streptomyces sp. NPDC046821 TaxID=3154702 RepID=UPI0033F78CCD
MADGYQERASQGVPGAVLWTSTTTPGADGPDPVPDVLPDGCMDLLWTEGRLFVAGPDTRGHRSDDAGGIRFAGIRFFPGTAPDVLGVPADELRDRRVDLADLWPSGLVRRLTERVDAAPDPAAALEAVAQVHGAAPPDPVLAHIVASLGAGRTVAATAERAGLSARSLHRRSLAAFGYGPKTLARVLRMQRALALARTGVPLAETATRAGYADQAHLAREVRELAGAPLTRLVRPPQGAPLPG